MITRVIRVAAKNNKLINQIESILFSCGRAISIDEINTIITNYIEAEAMIKEVEVDESKKKKLTNYMIKKKLKELKETYEERDGPLMIIDEDDEKKWKISVKETYIGLARTINPHTELSKALMETLSVIAWKQPILQSTVIKIRTTNAYDHINELIQYGFVLKQRYGRSFLLKLTQKFYDYFDVDKKKIRKIFKDMTDSVDNGQQNLSDVIDQLDENEQAISPREGTESGDEEIVDALVENSSEDILTKEDTEPLDGNEDVDVRLDVDTVKTLEKSIDVLEDLDEETEEEISNTKGVRLDEETIEELESAIDSEDDISEETEDSDIVLDEDTVEKLEKTLDVLEEKKD